MMTDFDGTPVIEIETKRKFCWIPTHVYEYNIVNKLARSGFAWLTTETFIYIDMSTYTGWLCVRNNADNL